MENYGWLSVLPPVLAIFLAIATKQVFISLTVGIWLGWTIINGWNPVAGIVETVDVLVATFEDAGNTRTTRSRGQVVYGADVPVLEKVDVRSVLERCHTTLETEQCYVALERAGFKFGPTFRVIQQLHLGEREVVARLEVPPAEFATYAECVLTPGILDGVLQSALWLLQPGPPEDLRPVPLGLGELVIAGALPPSCQEALKRYSSCK